MERSKEGELCCRQRWVTFGAVELTEGGDPIGISRGVWDTFGFSAFPLSSCRSLFFPSIPQKRNSISSSAFSCQGSSKSRCETQWQTHSIILHGSAASA